MSFGRQLNATTLAIGLCTNLLGCAADRVTSLGGNLDCDGSLAATGTRSSNYCETIPALLLAPTIDGVLDCAVTLAPISPDLAVGIGPMPDIQYALGWRKDGLYVFVHVAKLPREPAPTPQPYYCGDSVHVFVDADGAFQAPPAYDPTGTSQLIAAAPGDDTTITKLGILRASDAFIPWRSQFATFPTADGYVLEAFIVAADLQLGTWDLAAGQRIGFDLDIDVGGSPSYYSDPTCTHKRAEVPLRLAPGVTGTQGVPHSNVNAFCIPTLLKDN